MKKLRLLLAAVAVLAIGLVGFSGTASAEGDLTHAEHLCVQQIEAGEGIDSCQKAPNPLLPETHEIIWGAFGFIVVMVGMWKFAVPAMKKTLDARAEKIQGDIDAAEAQKADTASVLAEYKAQLADAKSESARIIEEARQTADGLRQQLQTQANADIAEMKAQAAADIESAKVQAIADLRGEVTSLAIGAAEQVVQRNLDRETNVALVENYINQVGAKN
jgi:F-type H+-transporting ATPase subunit b